MLKNKPIKKFILAAILINLALIFGIAVLGYNEFLFISLYFFFLLCGIEKLRSWISNEDIRMGPMVKLNQSAPKLIRFAGLITSLILIFYGCFMLIDETMKIWLHGTHPL